MHPPTSGNYSVHLQQHGSPSDAGDVMLLDKGATTITTQLSHTAGYGTTALTVVDIPATDDLKLNATAVLDYAYSRVEVMSASCSLPSDAFCARYVEVLVFFCLYLSGVFWLWLSLCTAILVVSYYTECCIRKLALMHFFYILR